MRFVIHHKVTGEILRQGVVPDGTDWHLLQVQADHEAVHLPGKGDPIHDDRHMVDVASGTIVAKPAPPAEAMAAEAWTVLRRRRDALLAASDWTQQPDAPVSDPARAAWRAYRQALRDLPGTTPDPLRPAWPETPKRTTA